jgi:hypothetical protein
MKSRPPPEPISGPRRRRPRTFAEIRRNAETRLRRGLKLDFGGIMRDVAALRARNQRSSR